ncbi:SCP-like protein [Ancylostoma ceylanicum]|uniref:SCP-like protein n=1 Tax=Ancylostoma ceylanicum TaxID=53326 RepID=A0A0D6M3G8_9BILA|nr:SCP-like protein [Ancylostoma ceylanicum]
MLKLAVLVLCVGWTSAKWDCNDKIPIKIRKQIVKYQNDRRDELLKGLVNAANGKLKPAKFMKKLNWSCGLEAAAASRCINGMINTNFLYQTGAASDIVVGYMFDISDIGGAHPHREEPIPVEETQRGCYPKPLRFNDFKKAMDNWWRQAGGYTDNRFTDRTREDFAQSCVPQMMNANATEVGCSYEKKGRLTSILCLYNSRVALAQPFYQVVEDEVTNTGPENEMKAQ